MQLGSVGRCGIRTRMARVGIEMGPRANFLHNSNLGPAAWRCRPVLPPRRTLQRLWPDSPARFAISRHARDWLRGRSHWLRARPEGLRGGRILSDGRAEDHESSLLQARSRT